MARGRVLHCIPTMGGGGAERQLTYLATEQVRTGREVDVAVWGDGPNRERLEASGARIHWLRGLHQNDPRLAWQMLRLVGRLAPDLVQTWTGVMDIPGGLACRTLSVPWLVCERAWGAWNPVVYGHTRCRLRIAITRGASAVVCNSAGAAAAWAHYLPARTPRRVIRNALPIAEIRRVAPRPRAAGAAGRKTVLAIGRFSHEKNWTVLVGALARVVRATGAAAVFCGAGRGQRHVERLIRHHGLADDIALPGYVDDVWARMKSADVCVHVSPREGCPNVVLEAMACGCPLVVSDIPAHRELLDEDTALIVHHADSGRMADAVVQALADPNASRRRARRAQARAEQWTPGCIAEHYEDLYGEILTRGRP